MQTRFSLSLHGRRDQFRTSGNNFASPSNPAPRILRQKCFQYGRLHGEPSPVICDRFECGLRERATSEHLGGGFNTVSRSLDAYAHCFNNAALLALPAAVLLHASASLRTMMRIAARSSGNHLAPAIRRNASAASSRPWGRARPRATITRTGFGGASMVGLEHSSR